MSKVLLVLVREYLENVRTKAFLIGVILTPLWFGLVFLVPLIARGQQVARQKVVVVDTTGVLADALVQALEAETSSEGEPLYEVVREDADGAWEAPPEGTGLIERLRAEVAEGDELAVLLTPAVLGKRPPTEGEPESGILHAASIGGHDAARLVLGHVNDVVNAVIMEERGIDPQDAALLAANALPAVAIARGGETGGPVQAILPFVFMMFLFMGIVGVSQMLVNSTIEEKGSRVYEILLSSLSPFQLMAGKVLGICAVGFTLLALWTGGGLLAAHLQGLGDIATGTQLGLFLAYYVLGFLLIASLMVAVGSACNTLKEAQNLMAPLSLLLALPLLIAMIVLKNPNSPLATVTSFIPPFTPFLMMARVSAVPGPPAWQIPASLALLAASTFVAIWLAARIFRIGILMYGKPPSLGEVVRWVREA